jgi:hypothetical protein
MRKYRIAEAFRQYYIEASDSGDKWVDAYLVIPQVPRFFDSLADARSWVATIKKGVVYHDAEAPPLSESDLQWECARDFRIFSDGLNHDAEDAPNLAQDERKAESDTSDGIKPLEWFMARVGRSIENTKCGWNIPIHNQWQAQVAHDSQAQYDVRYADPR